MWSNSAQSVLAMRDSLQVPRVCAAPNTAEMIEFLALWDRPAEVLVGKEMARASPVGFHCDLAIAWPIGAPPP